MSRKRINFTSNKDLSFNKISSKSVISHRYSDVFSDAVLILRDIIQYETEMKKELGGPEEKKHRTHNMKQIFPIMIDNDKFNEYIEMKIYLKQLLDGLLRVRSEFNNKLRIDIRSPIFTVQDVQPEEIKNQKVLTTRGREQVKK